MGFGEGKGREIEKKEERQGSAFWRKKKASFVFIRFWKRFFLHLFFFFGFRKVKKYIYIVLMWKIVGVSETSVMYILVIGPCVARFYEKTYKINV